MDITNDLRPRTTVSNHNLAAEARAVEGIRQRLDNVKNRRTRLASAVFDEIRDEYDIPR